MIRPKGPSITWDKAKLRRLEAAINAAEDADELSFKFEDEGVVHELLVSYAAYLVQYLRSILP